MEIPTEELQDNLLRETLRAQLPRWNIPPNEANAFADWIAENWRTIPPWAEAFSRAELQDNLLRETLRAQLPRWNIPPNEANAFADWIARNWPGIPPSERGFSREGHFLATLRAIDDVEAELEERHARVRTMLREGFWPTQNAQLMREINELVETLFRLEASR